MIESYEFTVKLADGETTKQYPAGRFLVVSDGKGHLPVKKSDDGPIDSGLAGAAHAALFKNYRGKEYGGPDKEGAKSRLKSAYKAAKMDWPDDKKKLSDLSLDQKRSAVGEAAQDQYGESGPWGYGRGSVFVKDFFDDYTILEKEGKLWKVTFTFDDDGNVKFGDPQPVAVEYVVKKAGPETLRETHFACDLQLSECVGQLPSGKPLYRIPVAVTGKFVKDGRPFEITSEHLNQVVANSRRRNRPVVIDFEHLSSAPEANVNGRADAAGWMHGYSVEHTPTGDVLLADAEWSGDTEQLIRDGRYRYFSPELNFDAKDKKTGEAIGCDMPAGALTNRPFLDMPAISLRETARNSNGILLSDLEGSGVIVMADSKDKKPTMFRAKKMAEGEHKGKLGLYDESGAMVGLADLPDDNDADDKKKKMREEVTAEVETTLGVKLSEAKPLIEAGKTTLTDAAKVAKRQAVILSDVVAVDGMIDRSKLSLVDGLSIPEYNSVLIASESVDKSITDRKFVPAQRKSLIEFAIRNPESFKALAENAVVIEHLKTVEVGMGGSGDPAEAASSEEKVTRLAEAYAKENKVTFTVALGKISRDPKNKQLLSDAKASVKSAA